MTRVLERAKRAAIPLLGGATLTALMRTTRHEVIAGKEYEREIILAGVPALYLLWHGRLLPCSYPYRSLGLGTLISQNRDGEYIARVIESWGYHVIRGSLSRGAQGAQLAIVRTLQAGRPVALTPDGPRGPRQKMKLGPLRAAQKAGVPVVPVSAGATAGWYFGSWDRFLVPKPFTWVPLAIGQPIALPPEATKDQLTSVALGVEAELNRLTTLVDEAAVARRG